MTQYLSISTSKTNIMFEKFKKHRENNRKFLKKQIEKLVEDSTEIRKERIKNRKEIAETIIQATHDDPCMKQNINIERLGEFVSDENKSLGVKRIIAIWVTLGYLLTNIVIIGLRVFPINLIFKLYMVFAFISCSVILSYFYTSYKMNNMFKLF